MGRVWVGRWGGGGGVWDGQWRGGGGLEGALGGGGVREGWLQGGLLVGRFGGYIPSP